MQTMCFFFMLTFHEWNLNIDEIMYIVAFQSELYQVIKNYFSF